MTVSAAPDVLRKVVHAFRVGGGEGKPMVLQVAVNWAPTEQEALEGAYQQWRFNALGGEVSWELRSPAEFERATQFVRPDDLRESVLISSDLAQHVAWLQDFVELGFEELQLHQVARNQRAFIDAFGIAVLPQLT